jgi:hypothetical protein
MVLRTASQTHFYTLASAAWVFLPQRVFEGTEGDSVSRLLLSKVACLMQHRKRLRILSGVEARTTSQTGVLHPPFVKSGACRRWTLRVPMDPADDRRTTPSRPDRPIRGGPSDFRPDPELKAANGKPMRRPQAILRQADFKAIA